MKCFLTFLHDYIIIITKLRGGEFYYVVFFNLHFLTNYRFKRWFFFILIVELFFSSTGSLQCKIDGQLLLICYLNGKIERGWTGDVCRGLYAGIIVQVAQQGINIYIIYIHLLFPGYSLVCWICFKISGLSPFSGYSWPRCSRIHH